MDRRYLATFAALHPPLLVTVGHKHDVDQPVKGAGDRGNRHGQFDNFRMNTGYGRYGAAYNMVGLRCFNEELSLLPKNPTEAKLQAMSTRGESTEPT
jgi:hypothetical protein